MKKGMICAPQPETVEAGAVALQRGGNAVDAALAEAEAIGLSSAALREFALDYVSASN